MVITRIDIASFGKLKNYSLQLNNSINVVLQDNSFGKSTLANFIRAMLFGLDYRKQGAYYVKNFQPWGSDSKFGGSLTLNHNGREYRIERYFGGSARNEESRLIDLSSGQAVSADNIGEYLLGLDAAAYEQSVYIPQEAVTITNNQSFEQKLAGMVQGDSQENDYNKAVDKLKQYSKGFKLERGRGGAIVELQDKITNLHLEKSQATNAKASEEQIKLNQKANAQRKSQLDIEERHLNEQLTHLRAESLAISTNNEQSKHTSEQLAQARQFVAQYDLPTIVADKNRLEQIYFQSSHTQDATSKKPLSKQLLGSVALIAIGVLVAVIMALMAQTTLGFALGGGLALIGAIVLLAGKRISRTPIERNADQQKVLDSLAQQYRVQQPVKVEKLLMAVNQLENQYNKCQTIISVLSGNSSSVNVQSSEQNTAKINADIALLENKINNVRQEKDSLLQLIGDNDRRLATLQEGVDIVTIDDIIASTEQQLKQAQQHYDNAQLAIELLSDARQELSTAYVPRLAQLSSSILTKATDNKLQGVVVDNDFNISLTEQGRTYPIDVFSRGIRELSAFCFRVSLADMVFNGRVPFLVVDDTFVNLDEKHFQSAIRLLQVLAKHGTQIIYMTCHQRCRSLLG